MMRILLAIVLLLPFLVHAAVPQPVRDSAYDWRCLNPDGTATNHQRQDTAIYACQTRAEANPGGTYYIEGGRYRVLVDAPPAPEPPPEPPPPPPPPPEPEPEPPPPEPEPIPGSVTLNWTAPTMNVDGTALTDLDGYRIHWGAAPRDYTGSLLLADPAALSATVPDLVLGSAYYFALTAFDSEGNESSYSNEVNRVAE